MNGETIYEVVKKLTGECYPYGSHSIDQDRYKSLNAKIYVASALLDEIEEAGRLYNRSEFSIQAISNKANEFLTEIRDCLNEIEYLPPLRMCVNSESRHRYDFMGEYCGCEKFETADMRGEE